MCGGLPQGMHGYEHYLLYVLYHTERVVILALGKDYLLYIPTLLTYTT